MDPKSAKKKVVVKPMVKPMPPTKKKKNRHQYDHNSRAYMDLLDSDSDDTFSEKDEDFQKRCLLKPVKPKTNAGKVGQFLDRGALKYAKEVMEYLKSPDPSPPPKRDFSIPSEPPFVFSESDSDDMSDPIDKLQKTVKPENRLGKVDTNYSTVGVRSQKKLVNDLASSNPSPTPRRDLSKPSNAPVAHSESDSDDTYELIEKLYKRNGIPCPPARGNAGPLAPLKSVSTTQCKKRKHTVPLLRPKRGNQLVKLAPAYSRVFSGNRFDRPLNKGGNYKKQADPPTANREETLDLDSEEDIAAFHDYQVQMKLRRDHANIEEHGHPLKNPDDEY